MIQMHKVLTSLPVGSPTEGKEAKAAGTPTAINVVDIVKAEASIDRLRSVTHPITKAHPQSVSLHTQFAEFRARQGDLKTMKIKQALNT